MLTTIICTAIIFLIIGLIIGACVSNDYPPLPMPIDFYQRELDTITKSNILLMRQNQELMNYSRSFFAPYRCGIDHACGCDKTFHSRIEIQKKENMLRDMKKWFEEGKIILEK